MTSRAVLVVEDEQLVATDLQETLECLGHQVLDITDNGAEAIELARRLKPDVVLMDIMLNGEMRGTEAGLKIGRMGIPVVYLTAYSDPATLRQAAESMPYGFLTKPYQEAELAAAVEVAAYKAQMERKLRVSERWAAAALRCVGDGVVVTDTCARVTYMNPVAEYLTGCQLETVRGSTVEAILHSSDMDGEPTGQLFMEALKQDKVMGLESLRLRSRSGVMTPVDYLAAPIRDDDDIVVGLVIVLHDMTERISFEERLEASEAHFRHIFEYSALGMAVVSLDGSLQSANRAFQEMVGYEADDLVGLPQSALSPPEDDKSLEKAYLEDLRAGLTPVAHFEKRYHPRGGKAPVRTLVHVTVLRGDGEQIMGYLYQVHDLSDRLQRQAIAQQATVLTQSLAAEREAKLAAEADSRAKSEFLATVSHEMRTPLAGVIGIVALLRGTPLDEEQRHYLELARLAGETLLLLVNDFLDFSKISAGKLDLEELPLDPRRICEDVAALVTARAEEKGLSVVLDLDCGPPPWFQGDAARIRQILLNLLGNAVKFTDQGSVQLKCRVLSLNERPVLRFEVHDTGIGIDTTILPKLFEPFVQVTSTSRLYGGTGLGLAIARRLTLAMGGQLEASSELGNGSIFTVDLPLEVGQAPATHPLLDPREPSTAVGPVRQIAGHILVAEDNPTTQVVLKGMLKRLGCTSVVVGNGKEVLEAIRQNSYDLLILDCQMPEMDGFATSLAIRAGEAVTRHLPIVALTASALKGDREKCLAAGMDDYLTKPVRIEELQVALYRHLGSADRA